ncbi:unnamed protein product [Mytilus edulis]|uniref:Aminotransferase class V domain-containing protein n=1 Tax=Mytilus edulis TaxID=6550 RepID=A0A8S3TS59_MYTED|nr:unnamed protein product [Mytilus edulis]
MQLSKAADDLVFVQNATTGVNTILKSLKFDKGDAILCTDNTYAAIKNTCNATSELPGAKDAMPSNQQTVPVSQFAREEYIDLKFPIGHEDEVVEMFGNISKNNPKVKLAVIDHITSPSAIRMPIEKLIPLCKEFGVLSLIDGAHAPGQIPLNLKELDADFYTVTTNSNRSVLLNYRVLSERPSQKIPLAESDPPSQDVQVPSPLYSSTHTAKGEP